MNISLIIVFGYLGNQVSSNIAYYMAVIFSSPVNSLDLVTSDNFVPFASL
jgi:hypothetical protein